MDGQTTRLWSLPNRLVEFERSFFNPFKRHELFTASPDGHFISTGIDEGKISISVIQDVLK
jgi:hypothetical protein